MFVKFSNGIQSNRDSWVYNFNLDALAGNVKRFISAYSTEVERWHSYSQNDLTVDDFVLDDDRKIKWSSSLKSYLVQGRKTQFDLARIRESSYRPFVKQHLVVDEILIHRLSNWLLIFPDSGSDNLVIWLKVGGDWPMFALMVDELADQMPQGGSQCFPLYTYDEDGSNRRDNITDWALARFRGHYADESLTKLDIFHYVYGLLHHPGYRERYADNLRRDLPHIPLAPTFQPFADAGRQLAELHLTYESQPEYPLDFIENRDVPLDWRVEKMRLSKDKTSLRYNDFLALSGIPPEVYGYRLGNRSALEWIVDQYQVKTDSRSGIVNDPNRADDPQYIVRLIGQIVTVSLETVQVVAGLAAEPFLVESA
ncbi:MAG: type ISP restriction/modification enzyme [Caldilineaceae bacterium]